MSVVSPTSTPLTSVIALLAPGAPSKGTPRSRARGLVWADPATTNMRTNAQRTAQGIRCSDMEPPEDEDEEVYKDGAELCRLPRSRDEWPAISRRPKRRRAASVTNAQRAELQSRKSSFG